MQAVSPQIPVRARKGGFLRDMVTISRRALRATARDTEVIIPALTIPVFMYLMTVGGLGGLRRDHTWSRLSGLPDSCGSTVSPSRVSPAR